MRMLSTRRVLLVLSAGALAAATVWLLRAQAVYARERHEFVDPPPAVPLPHDFPGLTRVTLELEGGLPIRGLYRPSTNGAAILFLHGSPGQATSLLGEARRLAENGFGVLLLDLPGYGESAGRRTWDATFRETATRGLEHLASQPETDQGRIGVHGYSMGSCIAAQLAARDDRVRGLVLAAPFTTLDAQLRHQFRSRVPLLPFVAVLAAKHAGVPVGDLDTRAAMARVRIPTLVIAGAEDQVIPASMPEELRDVAAQGTLWVAPHAGHVGLAQAPGYHERLLRFWTNTLSPAPRPRNEP